MLAGHYLDDRHLQITHAANHEECASDDEEYIPSSEGTPLQRGILPQVPVVVEPHESPEQVSHLNRMLV